MNEFILDVLRLQADYDYFGAPIIWRFHDEEGIIFLVLCNDLFAYSSADVERIEPGDVALLRQSIEDVRAVLQPETDRWYCSESFELGCALFCARKRQVRPLEGALPEQLLPLFHAAGPQRSTP